ncbi:hypothetical protein L1049_026584 [Liquidambar formosana]|uniref:Uncharacterized protein n=1 Tax=Liquidambar formosana TaxID=63359 RepID=A0AAP0NF80_LIQFO
MGNSKHTGLILQKLWRRRFQSSAERKAPTDEKSGVFRQICASNCRASLEEKLKTKLARESGSISIYRVPTNMREVEPKAFDPNIISIGPYHHGVPRLQAMEELKLQYFGRLLDPSRQNVVKLETLKEAMKKSEQEARSCYSENLGLCSDKFVEIMVLDGCFIIEFFRDLMKHKFKRGSVVIENWKLPIIRRDLIMLENQLPLSVLCKLFELTSSDITPTIPSLQELALRYFDPLMPRSSKALEQSISAAKKEKTEHFLDLFRTSILPERLSRGKEPCMFRSMTELKEAIIKIKKEADCQPLDLSFKGRVLKIPPLYINDYRGTLFRNLVALEQCHPTREPDIMTYLFFLDRLINSAKDVELLHYAEVIQHSLGSNKEVAKLVNSLCRELARDYDKSYLHEVIGNIDGHCKKRHTVWIATLKHNYFNNWWAGMSTIAAVFLLYLTLLQTFYGFVDAQEPLNESMKTTHFWRVLWKSITPYSSSPGANENPKDH